MPALVVIAVVVLAGLAALAAMVVGLLRRIAILRANLATTLQRLEAFDGALGALRIGAGSAE